METKNILVRAPNWIGDQVLAYPFFHHLRRSYPRARIVSVCVEWVRDIQFQGLIDEVFVLPRAVEGTLREKISILEDSAKKLRAMGSWDLGISLPNSISAAWLLYRAGAERRRGYRVDGRGILLNDGLRWDSSPERHRGQAYLDLLPEPSSREAKRFWDTPAESELDEPVPGELGSFDVAREWPEADTLSPPDGDYWVLAPGATADSRRWPIENFAPLARKAASELGWKGLVVGGAKEAGIALELCSDPELKLVDFTAQSSVAGLWKVFRNSRFTVTNESGLAHVAALSGAFVQIVCGAADPRRTRPLGPGRVQVSINPVECWPCEKNICLQSPESYIRCLRGIRVDSVWEEIRRGLRLEQ